ncbi:PREDICTED: retinal cone rhodopsin-sensitive cGMP 3',5'-cyclic phosphodiesterase subunit gamma-like isoform X2 [Poecilia mexicana]|uniref:retinal cone rhodopsin-sensitive cGMP 3',5'-cyclic phosphodiesterase subunit gamma-like isoform X1 n=1 Tax=Poecilia mexicana TaxID=48701 RepID=UPI00072E2A52|nr:PREDICTED: retinal cone rhodopsin-sensitive cGMP 3',5'-cyclic phosphodiesterase subunit gamma-like isoform X1 [Poecilia mexicana]XP_014855201.1 PREDICTED: retinal cone rhodopsin-sensitive cGMP 3',5'-cyclic phosphodiesterase subunit gamma-like isoform X2 [Poecilia mexicana]
MENMNASSEAGKPSPAELKQKDSRQFKSKAPKPGQKGFDSALPGMEGLDDAAVICPWEEFGDVELSDLAQFGTA